MLACPHEDCPEQNEYLAEMSASADRYFEQLAWPPKYPVVDDEYGC